MSSKIITLSPQLANQIAAGEVVERPLSVVKELVENSLDAGATQIEIRLYNGGIDMIEVKDNGEGMGPDDLVKAVEKYSTSKIKSLEDLYEVMTFGFRGEALASISSVSQFFMSSKLQESTSGMSINNTQDGGWQQQEIAHERGTIVRVEHIFYNTPARLNYLKQARSEYLKIADFIQKMSLVYPDCSFLLEHDDKKTFFVSHDQGFLSRISSVMGENFGDHTLSLDTSFGGIRIQGVITDPKISFPQKNKQVLFVNKRLIQSPIISKAISDAYKRYIPHGNHPGYILFVALDPTQVDVNVHPRKMEVRFAQESTLFRAIYHALEDTLKSVSLIGDTATHISSEPPLLGCTIHRIPPPNQPNYYTGSGTKFKSYSPYTQREAHPSQAALQFSQSVLTPRGTSEEYSSAKHFGDLHESPFGRIIGQLHNSYIIVQTLDGMMLLDQHALAERVIYEKLALTGYSAASQSLIEGVGMHLDLQEYEAFCEYQQYFGEIGFEIQELSHQNILIASIPDFLAGKNIETIFRQILGDVSSIGSQGFVEVKNKIWAYIACRSAIKFGDVLSLFEMHALLRDASLDYAATCPHGRPVVWEVGLQELKKKYER